MRLYPALLGRRFEGLPAAIRAAHRHATAMRGTVTIERGASLTSHIAAVLAGFPKACSDAPCEVAFIETGKGERWVRDMNGSVYSSTLMPASVPGCLDESFGAYGFRFRLHTNDEGVHFELIGHTLICVRVPRAFWPRIITRERDVGGRYAFFVEARTFTGVLLVRYAGLLSPVVAGTSP